MNSAPSSLPATFSFITLSISSMNSYSYASLIINTVSHCFSILFQFCTAYAWWSSPRSPSLLPTCTIPPTVRLCRIPGSGEYSLPLPFLSLCKRFPLINLSCRYPCSEPSWKNLVGRMLVLRSLCMFGLIFSVLPLNSLVCSSLSFHFCYSVFIILYFYFRGTILM